MILIMIFRDIFRFVFLAAQLFHFRIMSIFRCHGSRQANVGNFFGYRPLNFDILTMFSYRAQCHVPCRRRINSCCAYI